jgi:hypothetical protein
LGGGCACGSICCNAACSSTPRHIRLSTGLFTVSSCSSTLLPSTRPSIEDQILPVMTPLQQYPGLSSLLLGNQLASEGYHRLS